MVPLQPPNFLLNDGALSLRAGRGELSLDGRERLGLALNLLLHPRELLNDYMHLLRLRPAFTDIRQQFG